MRNRYFSIIIILIIIQSCVQKPSQNVLNQIDIRKELGFKAIETLNKSEILKSYFTENNFCYFQLNLFKDSTFFESSNCEAHMQFSVGKWRKIKNLLILRYTPIDKFNMILDYSIKRDTSKFFVFEVLNQNTKPIKEFQIYGFKKGESVDRSMKYGFLLTNELGQIKLKKEDYDSISIVGFQNITNKTFTFKSSSIPDTLRLKLFYNRTCFFQFPTYNFTPNESKFIVKGKKLIGTNIYLKEVNKKTINLKR